MGMEIFWGCADSSSIWKGKSTSCTSAFFLSRYRGYSTCPECHGSRLRLEARQVRIDGHNICEVCAMTVEDAAKFFAGVKVKRGRSGDWPIGCWRNPRAVRFLTDVGLEYLTLDRLASTLSGRRSATDSACDFAGFAAGGDFVCA